MVKAWRETVVIPTYEVGKMEKAPMFMEKRVYQGSSGVVYPYPVIEKVSDEKTDKEWQAIWLENEYIKVMVLPELGGRIQMAYDKVKQRHFVYYNHVIKPALVGLTGPWISGGIEFNWPQHHRPSTYLPVDSKIVENEDGSVTVWVNELERMTRQKGMAGFTLRPGCAYLEIQGRVSNPTPLPQTFLWWANPAVEVNDHYQSVFPPDVNAVFDHGKRAVSTFPIATGTYYKMDYSAGVDISNYKNIKVPTSYMAVNSKYDFEGGYENDTHGGMLHVASHHYSPGKKQWTWGNGDFGRAWDHNLTDKDARGVFRPYIELMAGVYTENQPDFSWLMPYEEKQFVQYFMPYRELGIVKQATKDFVFNIEQTEHGVHFKVLATSKQEVRLVLCSDKGEQYYNKVVTLSPEAVFEERVDVNNTVLDELTFTITHCPDGQPLLMWHAENDDIRPIPDAAEAALPPVDTKTNDQLYLTGLHLEQYRHATWSALDYYEEALRRDPNDVRCLNQTGLWYLRRGRFKKAEPYLRKAVKIWQKRNPNPYDGEAIFNLALCLKCLSRPNEAYELFWKATWNKAWADAAYFQAACISTSQGRYSDALDELNRALVFNSCNHKARALKATLLRLLGQKEEALAWIQESYKLDHFNFGCMFEEHLLTGQPLPSLLSNLNQQSFVTRDTLFNYHELALDYAQAGLWQECIDILQITTQHPLTHYYLGWAQFKQGKFDEAKSSFEKAEAMKPDYCFPNRLEDILALETAKTLNPNGAHAPYYLGCLYYDKRQYDVAIENWEHSSRLNPDERMVWRNLALARFNKQGRREEALEYMEKAFAFDKTDARMLMELDQLYKRMKKPYAERLAFLQQHSNLIQQRDDLVLEEITLLNQLGHYEEAMHKLDAHHFHPWEGGEGKVTSQYQVCRLELAKRHLQDSQSPEKAIALLKECLTYPRHLGEGKLETAQENDFNYYLGVAYKMMGDVEQARHYWQLATQGPQEPAAALYYNDSKPEKIFYQGLALRRLAELSDDAEENARLNGEANGRFHCLVNYGKQHIFETPVMDYFAVSLPDMLVWDDDLGERNRLHCLYLLALGYYGLGDYVRSERYQKELRLAAPKGESDLQFTISGI